MSRWPSWTLLWGDAYDATLNRDWRVLRVEQGIVVVVDGCNIWAGGPECGGNVVDCDAVSAGGDNIIAGWDDVTGWYDHVACSGMGAGIAFGSSTARKDAEDDDKKDAVENDRDLAASDATGVVVGSLGVSNDKAKLKSNLESSKAPESSF